MQASPSSGRRSKSTASGCCDSAFNLHLSA
jgi:hypothetical protein